MRFAIHHDVNLSNDVHLGNPEAWGYLPLGDRTSFIPNHQSVAPPFELALVGSGSLEVPQELEYMVSVHRGLDYTDFYKLVSRMDIVVPAFADNGCELLKMPPNVSS